jgi:hypothetical protein
MWDLLSVTHFLATPLRNKSRRSLTVISEAEDDLIDPMNPKNIVRPLVVEQLFVEIFKMPEERGTS